VKNHPTNIEEQLVEYLNVEFGEFSSSESKLDYVGEWVIDGENRYVWQYLTLSGSSFATVTVMDDGSPKFSVLELPKHLVQYRELRTEIQSGDSSSWNSFSFDYSPEFSVSSIEEVKVEFGERGEARISCEIYHSVSPPQIYVSIVVGGHSVDVKGASGLQLTIALNAEFDLLIEVGSLDDAWQNV